MGKSPLILAALAKDAAPSLNIVKVQKHATLVSADFDGALLTADDGKHYIVRIANTPTAATNQEAELRALKALTKNGSLPFAVTSQLASITTRDGELVRVLNYVYGSQFDIAEIGSDEPIVESVAKALAAIHNLPLSVVQDIDFPEYTTSNILKSCASELDRAMETAKVPSVLLNRWEQALGNENLFRFMPTVINGLINDESILETDGEVTGILDWMDLQIGDPARDFGWLLARASEDTIYNFMLAYQAVRPGADENIRQRAQLYSELAWASFLVVSINNNNEDDILDAQGELERMAAEVEAGRAPRLTPAGFAPQVVDTSTFDNLATWAVSPNTPEFAERADFAEPAEPIFATSNLDQPVVDFASTATAPIEIVEATNTAEAAVTDLPPFLAGDLPDFLIEDELDDDAKNGSNANPKDELF